MMIKKIYKKYEIIFKCYIFLDFPDYGFLSYGVLRT